MSDPYVGQIRILGCNFAPKGYAFCNGQVMPIAQNTALFSLLGTMYGGNGTTNFALPDLRGRFPVGGMSSGAPAGLNPVFMGEAGGTTAVNLLTTEMPVHSHTFAGTTDPATTSSPSGAIWAVSGARRATNNFYTAAVGSGVQMSLQALGPAGSSSPHNNMSPYQTVNFCIAVQGIFPSRN